MLFATCAQIVGWVVDKFGLLLLPPYYVFDRLPTAPDHIFQQCHIDPGTEQHIVAVNQPETLITKLAEYCSFPNPSLRLTYQDPVPADAADRCFSDATKAIAQWIPRGLYIPLD